MCDVTVDTSELVAQVINPPHACLNKLSLIHLIFCACYDFDGFIQLSKVLFLPEKCERFERNILMYESDFFYLDV